GDDLGFRPADNERLFLYSAGKGRPLDARVTTNSLRGRSDEHDGRWLWPDVPTPAAANSFAFHDEIVINEIMYHARPQYETDAQPFVENDEEWIELFNRGTAQVDLSGWKIEDAVGFEFATGTVLQPGEYLVVAKDAAALSAKYPGIAIVGNFSRSLGNSDDRILLVDEHKNPADEVHYYERGKWAESADGGGSSLELRDPDADNSAAAAWAASNEADRSAWEHYTYTRTVAAFPYDPPINFHEFILGLLDVGEVLIDNVSVIESPGGANIQLIQNGSFEADAVGGTAGRWRIGGTHNQSRVIDDPDQPGNQVLRLVATGKAHYLSNHAETTLANRARVINGRTYQISYDAKWISGSPQLRSELFHKDAAKTTILSQPARSGTPGARNSTFEANIGPTYEGFTHSPIVPTSSDNVTVSVAATDSDAVAAMTLRYAVNGTGTFRSVAMTLGADGTYRATIPAQSNGTVVQFYVEGRDTLGAVSTFPAAGPDSRALLKVDNNFNPDSLRHNVQIIMTPADTGALHLVTNMMHNNRYGSTLVYDGQQAFYDVGTRLKGSMFSRNGMSRTGYNVRFYPDEKFRGVHENITFDQANEQEIVVKHLSVQAGLMGAMYDDVVMLETPSGSGGGPTLMSMARHGDVFLDSQFERGTDGTVFKFEGIRVMTSTVNGSPEGLKIYQPIGWVGNFDIANLGDDKEVYRWPYLILNNRARDDYTQIIEMAKAMSLSGTALENAVADVLDVDQWAQTFAMMSLTGIGDAYSQGNPHNLNFYVRPEDNKVLAFPWDWDFTFSQSTSAPLHGGKNIGDVLNRPIYQRLLYGHMLHMIDTVFNTAYMNNWLSHYGAMLGRGFSYSGNISNRGSFVTNAINNAIPEIDFTITTNRGNPFSTSNASATIRGDGWVDVREIRLAGSVDPLEVKWTDNNSWQIVMPLAEGANELDFEAYNFRGELIATDSITVTSTSDSPRVADVLRISELMYNPHDPPAASPLDNDQ
ncbi:MAG: lamin tail domain-containing protein, partial [Planctomycetes bacterium]|nr:lamin tail domain-containing protein [Planctomycetota bacterium]